MAKHVVMIRIRAVEGPARADQGTCGHIPGVDDGAAMKMQVSSSLKDN